MRNKLLLVFLSLVLVVSLAAFAACAKEEEAPPVEEEAPPVEEEAPPVEEEAPPVEEVWEWPKKLIMGSWGVGAAIYAAQIAWTTLLDEDTGMKIRIVCEENTEVRYKWLSQGIIDTTVVTASLDMMHGTHGLAFRDGGPIPVRILCPTFEGQHGYVARGDSGIKTPYDVKPGMKLIYLSFIPVKELHMAPLLAWAKVDPEDVIWVPCPTSEATARFIIDGRGDITYGEPDHPIWFEAEAAPHGLSWIDLDAEKDPEGADRFMAAWPYGSYFGELTVGVPSALGVKSFRSVGAYYVMDDTDPELVYHIVKWLDENYDRYKDAHPWCAGMTLDNILKLAVTKWGPLHEGVVRYLKEKGLWTEAHEARRQLNIDNITKWVDAYQTAIDMADEKGIKVDPKNEEWIELWENYKKQLNLQPLRAFPKGLD